MEKLLALKNLDMGLFLTLLDQRIFSFILRKALGRLLIV